MIDLKELRSLAEKATPGPWRQDGTAKPWSPRQRSPFNDWGASVVIAAKDDEDLTYIVEGGAQDEQGGAVGVLKNEDAAYIAAANPQTIIYLLDRINELERE